MNNPYDLHSWSKHYREELMRDVQARDLPRSTRSRGGARSRWVLTTRVWSSMLSLLGGAELVE